MARRTAITSTKPLPDSSGGTVSSAPTASNARSTSRQSQSQPATLIPTLAATKNADEAASIVVDTRSPSALTKKLRDQRASHQTTPTKKIIRPPKYHETRKFLDKESKIPSELAMPTHLGHRVGETLRVVATTSRIMKRAALDLRPLSWGYGTRDGTLGHNNTDPLTDVLKRIAAFRQDFVRQVSAGNKLSMFLSSSGRVFVSGRLFLHQDGTKMWRPREFSFTQVNGADEDKDPVVDNATIREHCGDDIRILSVTAGHLAGYAIDDRGKVYAWGTKRYGQLGLGEDESNLVVGGVEHGKDTSDRSSDDEQDNQQEEDTDEADEDPIVKKPLRRHDPVEPTPRLVLGAALERIRMVKLSAGNHFVLAMSSCGKAFSWGWNVHGQLGHGQSAEGQVGQSPRHITSRLDSLVVTDIAAGHSHSLVVALTRVHGDTEQAVYANYSMVFAFGRGLHGCLGIGGVEDQSKPVEVEFFRGLQPSSVVAGHDHSLVVCSLGSCNYVYAFGGNTFGQLGIAQAAIPFTDMPLVVDELSGLTITAIGAGAYVSSALTGDGELYTWGDGTHGKTARPDKRTTFVPWKIPTEADSSSNNKLKQQHSHRVVLEEGGFVTQLSMGAHHSLALYRTAGTPDRWRKFPMGPVVPYLTTPEVEEAANHVVFCESSSAHATVVAFGIVLHCEQCAIGPLCRLCSRRCHVGHNLIPRHLNHNVDKSQSAPVPTIACACGSRRPPPPPPRAPRQHPILDMRQGSTLYNNDQKKPSEENAPPVYCTMAFFPANIPEDTVLR